MTPITNFEEAGKYLQQFYDKATIKYDLNNMVRLMDFLGNPQEKFKSIHVAGTSGKTSTAYFTSALLAASNKKVGLTVSPHVDSINERTQINNQPLPEKVFCKELTEYASIIKDAAVKPSWFEAMVGFAFWYFAKSRVDYVVIEVGLGGLLDATNVIKRSDKVCVITDIGLDHMGVLGGTLNEIAAQKIGIAQPGNEVFVRNQTPEITGVFNNYCQGIRAHLNIIDDSRADQLASGMPEFQAHNWRLANEVFKYISNRDSLQHLTSKVLQETQLIQVPGRMDVKQVSGKTLIMDGAHNAQKMTAFLTSFKRLYPEVKPAVLLSLKDGKEYQDLIPLLKPVANRFILTTFEASQDIPSRSMDIDTLLAAFHEAGLQAKNIPDQHEAYQELIAGPEKVCVITGSFYLLSQIRNNEHLV